MVLGEVTGVVEADLRGVYRLRHDASLDSKAPTLRRRSLTIFKADILVDGDKSETGGVCEEGVDGTAAGLPFNEGVVVLSPFSSLFNFAGGPRAVPFAACPDEGDEAADSVLLLIGSDLTVPFDNNELRLF